MINLEFRLKELDIRFVRYNSIMNKNTNMNLDNDFHALLIDSTGILADLYKYSSISYVGCGFGSGVHNVAEPAIYGNTICFGPKYHILNEAVEMVEEGIAYSIKNSKELSAVLSMILNHNKLKENSKKIENYIELKSDYTNKIIYEIF